MAAKPLMGDYKTGTGWAFRLQDGPYDGLVVRVWDHMNTDTVTFHGGAIVYRRHLWLDDDGRPVQVKAKRAKRDGGDFTCAGYRYVWEDTGVRLRRTTSLYVNDVLVAETNRRWENGVCSYDELVEIGVPDPLG